MRPYTPSLLLEAEIDADLLLAQAVGFCAEKLNTSKADIERALVREDPEVHSTLRYAIAKGIGSYLGQLGCGVHAVYLYGSAMNGDARSASDIDLIILIDHKRDQARTLLGKLDVALVTSYRALLGSESVPLSLLDVHLVDVEEEQQRHGYGSVLRSTETSPVCLWR